MITSITYHCRVCGKPRSVPYETNFKGIDPDNYRCAECAAKNRKIKSEVLVSYICCKCGHESGKKHLKDFKLVNHKWTCTDCYRDENTTLF